MTYRNDVSSRNNAILTILRDVLHNIIPSGLSYIIPCGLSGSCMKTNAFIVSISCTHRDLIADHLYSLDGTDIGFPVV